MPLENLKVGSDVSPPSEEFGSCVRSVDMASVSGALCLHTAKLSDYLEIWQREQEDILATMPAIPINGNGSYAIAPEKELSFATSGLADMIPPKVPADDAAIYENTLLDFSTNDDSAIHLSREEIRGSTTSTETVQGPLGPKRIQQMSKTLKLKVQKSASSLMGSRWSLQVLPGDGIKKLQRNCCWCCPNKREKLKWLTSHRYFETVSATIICANAGVIAYSSDYAFEHLDNPDHPTVVALERIFCVIYTLEFLLRWFALGCRYFVGPEASWNIFDFTLVVVTWYDQLASLFEIDSANLSFLRIARLFKMLRVLRMFRLMRAFRELRLILASIFASAKSLIWALSLLLIVTFMFGIWFLQSATTYLQDKRGDEETERILRKYWGSVFESMHTLYMVSTNGIEWNIPTAPFREMPPTYSVFLAYIAFFLFVVENTLTSLFVEGTIQNSEKDLQVMITEEMKKKEEYIRNLKRFFDRIDENRSGSISYDEFVEHVDAPEMVAFAANLDIDATDVNLFFHVLSQGGKREVDLETFVVGCIKLKGNAKSMDLIDLINACKRAQFDQELHFKFVQGEFGGIRKEHAAHRELLHATHAHVARGAPLLGHGSGSLMSPQSSMRHSGSVASRRTPSDDPKKLARDLSSVGDRFSDHSIGQMNAPLPVSVQKNFRNCSKELKLCISKDPPLSIQL